MKPAQVDVKAFLEGLAAVRKPDVPVVDEETALVAVTLLREGYVSARRMAREMDATFEDVDATFAHHEIEYRLFE